MASTRNKNSLNNYNIEQNQYENIKNYNLYENSQHGKPTKHLLPDKGLNSCKMDRFQLHWDSVSVESQLMGIGSSNLVNPFKVKDISPTVVALPHGAIHTFDEHIMMPEPLVMEKDQRPNIFN